MTDERRRHPRVPVTWPVRLWVDQESILGHTEDVSPSGLCVVVAPTSVVKLGKSYRVDVLAGDREPFSLVAEARHVDDRRVGFETDRRVPFE